MGLNWKSLSARANFVTRDVMDPEFKIAIEIDGKALDNAEVKIEVRAGGPALKILTKQLPANFNPSRPRLGHGRPRTKLLLKKKEEEEEHVNAVESNQNP